MSSRARAGLPRRGRSGRTGLAAAVTLGLVMVSTMSAAAPAHARGLSWQVAWGAPMDAANNARVDGGELLTGTASPPSAQVGTSATITVVASGLPAACGPKPGPVVFNGESFAVDPGLVCNGSYDVVVSPTARVLGLPLPNNGPKLQGRITRASGGVAPAGPSATVDSTDQTVTLRLTTPTGGDAVGSRVFRDGAPIGDLGVAEDRFVDRNVAWGSHRYSVSTLRWGGEGPGSGPVVSPQSLSVIAVVEDGRPTVGVSPGTPAPSSGGGGSAPGGSGTPARGGAALAPPARRVPSSYRSRGPLGQRSAASTKRSTKTKKSASATATTGPEVFEERLPYEAKTTGELVSKTIPGSSRLVSVTEPVRHRQQPGLLVPAAVAVVLVGAALHLRVLVRRSHQSTIALEPD